MRAVVDVVVDVVFNLTKMEVEGSVIKASCSSLGLQESFFRAAAQQFLS